MKFVNNWRQQMALAQGAASAQLDLPDGEYVLVMSDAAGASATRWEYLRAVVVGGVGTLQRGQEGSEAQEWPAGSWVSCSLTAGTVQALFDAVTELYGRVSALEAALPPSVVVTLGEVGGLVGYMPGQFGSVSPAVISVPNHGLFQMGMIVIDTPAEPYLTVRVRGTFPAELVQSISVEGVGVLNPADGFAGNSEDENGPITYFSWELPGTDWFGAVGQKRAVEFVFAPV